MVGSGRPRRRTADLDGLQAPSIRRAAARGFNPILNQYAAPGAIGERIALYRAEREARGHAFDPMQVAVARQVYVAKNKADKEAALERLAQYTQRTVDVSRAPEAKGARTFSPTPTGPAGPRPMRSTEPRMKFATSSRR